MSTYVFDLEADGFLDVATKVHCGTFISLDGKDNVSFSPLSGKDYIEKMLLFMDTASCLIAHNGFGYDFPLLKKLFGYEYKGEKVDTLVMSRLFQPKRSTPPHCPVKNKPHSIEVWGFRVGRGKVAHEDWSKFTPEMLHRNIEDVEIGRLVYLALLEEKKQYNWDPALKLTHKLFNILQKQEEYGWLVDQGWMIKSIRMLNHWMDRIDRVLDRHLPLVMDIEEDKQDGEYKWVKAPFLRSGEYNANVVKWMERVGISACDRVIAGPFSRVSFRRLSIDKPNEIKGLLLDMGWEPAQWNTDDDGNRTSPKLDKDDPFDGIESGIGRLVARYLQCRSRKSIIEGWLTVIRPDGRIPSVVANLAETGRATHRNIVNVPNGEAFFGKWMRKMFVAKKGWVLVGTDSAGCQIRMLAARMGDKSYMDTVLNGDKDKGTDIHSVNMRAAGLDSRGKAKTFFYGFLFGAGDAKVGKIVRGTAEDGRRLKEQFLEGLPALRDLLDKLTGEWRKNAKKRTGKWGRIEYYDGWVTGLDGRPIFVASEHAILVYVLQSDEAIMMAAAYCWLYKELTAKYKWGEDFGIVAWYHDEYTVECRPEIAEDIARIAEECIVRAGKFFNIACPHAGEAAIGKDWFAIH